MPPKSAIIEQFEVSKEVKNAQVVQLTPCFVEPPTGPHASWIPVSMRWYIFAVPLLLHIIQLGVLAHFVTIYVSFNGSATPFYFDLQNASAYFAWQYLPLLVLLLTEWFWEAIYLDTCRLEPFHQLSHLEGATFKDSLCQNYANGVILFVPFRALFNAERSHVAVALAALTKLQATILLPVVTASMWKIDWNEQQDRYSYGQEYTPPTAQVVLVDTLVYLALAIHAVTIVTGFCLCLLLNTRRSGLLQNPLNLEGLAKIFAEGDALRKLQILRSFDRQSTIDEALWPLRLQLRYRPDPRTGSTQAYIAQIDLAQQLPSVTLKEYIADRREAHSPWLWARTYWLISFVCVAPLSYLQMTGQGVVTENVWASKACSAIIAVLAASLWSNWRHNVALLEPFYRLTGGDEGKTRGKNPPGSTNALQVDYISSPVVALQRSLRSKTGSKTIGFMSLVSIIYQINIVLVPGASNNNKAINNVTTMAMVPWPAVRAIYATFAWNILTIVVSTISWIFMMRDKRRAFLPRKPFTLASIMLYMCRSQALLEDVKADASRPVTNNGTKYALGWVQYGQGQPMFIGIDRLERVKKAFKFGEKLPLNVT